MWSSTIDGTSVMNDAKTITSDGFRCLIFRVLRHTPLVLFFLLDEFTNIKKTSKSAVANISDQ